MFAHNKALQYTVRVSETNPGLADLLLAQFGGPQGEIAAAARTASSSLGDPVTGAEIGSAPRSPQSALPPHSGQQG